MYQRLESPKKSKWHCGCVSYGDHPFSPLMAIKGLELMWISFWLWIFYNRRIETHGIDALKLLCSLIWSAERRTYKEPFPSYREKDPALFSSMMDHLLLHQQYSYFLPVLRLLIIRNGKVSRLNICSLISNCSFFLGRSSNPIRFQFDGRPL